MEMSYIFLGSVGDRSRVVPDLKPEEMKVMNCWVLTSGLQPSVAGQESG